MDVNPTQLLVGAALGVLVVVLGHLVTRWARRRWQHRRYGAPLDHNTLLVASGRRMSGALDRQALAALLTAELPRALRASRALLLLPERHRLVSMDGDALSLPISHAAVRWVASGGEAQRSDGGTLRKLIGQGRTDLSWTRVWVPLMRGFDLRGMWLLGARNGSATPLRYSAADLRWLTSVGRQAAVVLEALYYAEQERWAADEMRALYRQVVNAREVERSRMSRELHDGVLQDLCAVTRDLRALSARPDAQRLERLTEAARLNDLAARSGETVQSLRAICNDLRPPLLRQDLGAALKALVSELDARSAAPIHIDLALDKLDLANDAALAVFRITQEALHNAIEHADASEIAVRLTQYPDRLRLTVTDDGQGISGGIDAARFVAQGHFGLAGMRERADMIGGRLDVQTAVDYGTVVVLEAPISIRSPYSESASGGLPS